MNQKGFINILLIVIVVALVGVGIYFVTRHTISPTPTPTPISVTSGEKIIGKVGERENSFLIQKINQDSVDGLWYEKYPVASNKGTPKTLHIGDDIGYACEGVSEKLISIDFTGRTITFNKIVGQPPNGGCPI